VRIGAISDVHEKGKHTTTFAEMHHLGFGAWIVDTPGIKEFVLYDLEKETLAQRFPEMRELMSECRFANCTHTHEPGCAVKEAVENGRHRRLALCELHPHDDDESHDSVKEEG
jgi:Predicted GTPases